MDKEDNKKFQIVGIYDADLKVGQQTQLQVDDKERGITLYLVQEENQEKKGYVTIVPKSETEAMVKFVNVPENSIQKVSMMKLGTYDKKKDLWVEFILFKMKDGGRHIVANCFISK